MRGMPRGRVQVQTPAQARITRICASVLMSSFLISSLSDSLFGRYIGRAVSGEDSAELLPPEIGAAFLDGFEASHFDVEA